MLTKEVLKNLKKANKAKREANTLLAQAERYQEIAVELTKKCKSVTEDEFHQVFNGARITARDTYWLVMHAKDQWTEAK